MTLMAIMTIAKTSSIIAIAGRIFAIPIIE
jgi:hypothetical protein